MQTHANKSSLTKQQPTEAIMKKLSSKQLDILINTQDGLMTKEFPGYSRGYLRQAKKDAKANRPEVLVKTDRVIIKKDIKIKETTQKYKSLIEQADTLEKENAALLRITKPIRVKKITPKGETINGDGVAVIVASDWHYEEEVGDTVNGLNEFNLKIADKRIENFWQNSLKLIQVADRDNNISTIVLALLGDFISSNIHDELLEINQLLPAEAIFKVQTHMISGIKFLLENTDKNIVAHCISGNHTRITQKIRHATFNGNSLEDFMYHNMAAYFKDEPRIKFNIPSGYLSYLEILGQTIRFHHGHAIRFGGGIGGIYIPANKAISQWNKARRADLDVFAHFHQLKDGGHFLINGSLIGYNAYAMSIKADYEEPKQLFFLINKHGRTGYTKIVV